MASTSYAGQHVDLIGPNGTVVASATPDAGPADGLQANLRISDFTIPTSGVYTLRVTSNIAGKYALIVSQATPSEAVLGYAVAQGLTTQSSVSAMLATLSFESVFTSMSTEELLGELIRNNLVSAAHSVSALETLLTTDGISLTNLRPDGILTALATAPNDSLLTSGGSAIDALTAKNLLQAAFTADPGTYLDVFSIQDLFALFDDSITSSAGAASDPLYAISTYASYTIPSTAPNVILGYGVWFTDTTGATNVPSPGLAVSATNAMPAGQHAIIDVDFSNVTGFGEGTFAGEGYLDPTGVNGASEDYYLIWMDQWEQIVQQRIANFFTQFKQLGGTLNSYTLDIETTGLGYWDLRTQNRLINASSTPSETIWQEMLADPRWGQIQSQLIAAGISANDLTLANISTWSIQSTDAMIWNAVAEQRLASYINTAIYAPIHAIFPECRGLELRQRESHADHSHRHLLGGERQRQLDRGSGWQRPNRCRFTVGIRMSARPRLPISLTHRSRRKSRPFRSVNSPMDLVNRRPVASPLVTFCLGLRTSMSVKSITIENRGSTWIDPQYIGTFQVASVSANGTSLTFVDPNTSATNPPGSYDLTYRLGSQNDAYVDTWSAYDAFVDDVNIIRSEASTSNVPIVPWISTPDWMTMSEGLNYTYYGESVFQAALSGAIDFRLWSPSTDTNSANAQTVSNLLSELNALVGYAGGKTITYGGVSWSAGYVMSGMDVNGEHIYRLTPDPTLPINVTSTSNSVSFQIGGQTVSFANAHIYTPPTEYSNLGYWIVQNSGTTNLVGGLSSVVSQVTSALQP